MKRRDLQFVLCLGTALAAASCDEKSAPDEPVAAPVEQPQIAEQSAEKQEVEKMEATEQRRERAKAEIEGAEGKDIEGEAEFSEDGKGVKIVVNVEDGPPGKKGIHIHEKGDCSDIPGKSMGSHFAPQGDKHALPSEPQDQRHLGDLGNIDIGSDGKGKLELTLQTANLKQGDRMSLLGKSVVIHEGEDMGAEKQPSGGSGTPIACGVIEKM